METISFVVEPPSTAMFFFTLAEPSESSVFLIDLRFFIIYAESNGYSSSSIFGRPFCSVVFVVIFALIVAAVVIIIVAVVV